MLPDHLIRELRYIELQTSRRFPNLRVGAHRSRVRGQGFDFDQHRAYRPGDDVRQIDWNATARLNAPFVRETHADNELSVIVAVDVSRSMSFGTAERNKQELLVLVSACLVFSALADQINTGFLTFGESVHAYQAPRRARARAWSFLEELWFFEPPAGGTALLPAVRYLTDHFKREGVIFIVSDFLTDEDLFAGRELSMLAARHDVVAVVIEDPAEAALPPGNGTLELRDVESGRHVRVGLGRALRARYTGAMRRRREELSRAFYRVPMDHVFVRSDQYAVEPLLNLFAARRRA